jgi:hypothetical protein
MGGWAEEVYYAMFQVAESRSRLGEAWPDIQDAYLRAWEYRPTRAEPLHSIAARYRTDQRYQLGYLFAERAAEIPLPEADILFVAADVYHWRALDEQAICASWIGKHAEAFTLCRSILARPDIPDDDRRRIAANRETSVPAMIEAASSYPDLLVRRLVAGPRDGEVTVSLVAGPDPAATEQTLNSFLHCCSDVQRVGRFLVLDAGMAAEDHATLLARYRFLEFIGCAPTDEPLAELAHIHDQIQGRYWLHLGQGWRFFAPEPLIARLIAVLEAEPEVVQVGMNLGDARTVTGASAAENAVRRAVDAGRYVLTDSATTGPAMIDTTRLDTAAATGPKVATLDEVLCIQEA